MIWTIASIFVAFWFGFLCAALCASSQASTTRLIRAMTEKEFWKQHETWN